MTKIVIKRYIALLACGIALAASAQQPTYTTDHNVAVPMRDGVVLRADILRPAGEGRFPVLVYRTPYNKQDALATYTTFRKAAERGYVVVVQDVRGRFASDGEFEPYRNEGCDGYDTIEWAAKQPWSDGTVGTFGLSYPGAVQWLAAVENPPHLKAMVPAMTYATPSNFFFSGGLFDLSWISWIYRNIAPDVRVKKNLAGPKNYEEAEAEWAQHGMEFRSYLPLQDLPVLKDVAPYYYEWMKHPAADPWWDWANLEGKFGRVQAAVLNFSGWYDDAYGPDGATSNFNGLVAARKGQPDARTKLIMGPWIHGIATINQTKAGERQFGDVARSDYDETILRWMDHYLRGIENGVDKEKPVRYFVMGADQWREADAWPPPAQQTSFYLNGQRKLRTAPAGDRRRFSSFVSDPANPVTDPFSASSGAHDYRALAERKDVLLFDSEPLTEDTEITGPITAEIYFLCDCRDTDLWVRVLDVAPDGTAYNLMSPGLDVMRASYRNGGVKRDLLSPGKIYKLRFEKLMTSNLFKKGHRLRVQISAAFMPHMSRNLHTGELEMTSAKMQQATIRIHHDRQHPSRIVLPMITGVAKSF
ncbi:MAG: CocE/NonD family hydrolase [Acidobacteriales bacterium]|nr:CocE/NonD family hydrolase [Terriglobales bacterium]